MASKLTALERRVLHELRHMGGSATVRQLVDKGWLEWDAKRGLEGIWKKQAVLRRGSKEDRGQWEFYCDGATRIED